MRSVRQASVVATIVVSLLWLLAGLQPALPAGFGEVPDTLSHGTAYAVLGFLSTAAAAALGATAAPLWGWAYATGHGALLELLQLFVPTRSTQLHDLLSDAVGSAVGAAIALAWRRR